MINSVRGWWAKWREYRAEERAVKKLKATGERKENDRELLEEFYRFLTGSDTSHKVYQSGFEVTWGQGDRLEITHPDESYIFHFVVTIEFSRHEKRREFILDGEVSMSHKRHSYCIVDTHCYLQMYYDLVSYFQSNYPNAQTEKPELLREIEDQRGAE